VINPVRVGVLVSGGGSNLQALLDAQKTGSLKSGRVALVISDNPSAYALTRAAEAGVPALALDKKALGREGLEREIIQALETHGIELIVLAGFLTILSPDFTRAYAGSIINVHPSLIPAFCGKGFYGLKVHEAALARGVKITGATVHFVDEVPDGGPIILQKAVRVLPEDSPETLQRRVMEEAEWVILPQAVEQICQERISHVSEQTL
jgi:phosphoribosylglycinamide formyltransferase-1